MRISDDRGNFSYDEIKILALQNPVTKKFSIDTTKLCDKVKLFILVETEDKDSDSANNVREITLNVKCKKEPKAVIEYLPREIEPGEVVKISASKSYDPDGKIVDYTWYIRPVWMSSLGEKFVGPEIEKVFEKKGEYGAWLELTDDSGLITRDGANIVVGVKPEASVSFTTESTETGTLAKFDASGSFDADGEIVKYIWDFGDGTEDEGMQIDHIYGTETINKLNRGSFTAKLSVMDNDGIENRQEVEIIAAKKPEADFDVDKKEAFTGVELEFGASASKVGDARIKGYEWEFGDGTKEKGSSVKHVFLNAGKYNVKLIVVDEFGMDDETAKEIAVFENYSKDVAITEIKLGTDKVVQDKEAQVNVGVANVGMEEVKSFKIDLRNAENMNEVVKSVTIEGMMPLESKNLEFSFNAGDEIEKADYIVTADYEKEIDEKNIANNSGRFSVNVVYEETCGNLVDDDGDGYADGGCIEVCGNGIDDDEDGTIDGGCGEICYNGKDYSGNEIDDDEDGTIDNGCGAEKKEVCRNEIDDDKDGLVDEDCIVETCGNKKDDNDNGKIDEGCEFTSALVAGETLYVKFKEEIVSGEEQSISVFHPFVGAVKAADIRLVSPSGKVAKFKTDEAGNVQFKAAEIGRYLMKVRKIGLVREESFSGIGYTTVAKRFIVGLPILLFTDKIVEAPLLFMVLLFLCVIAAILAFERSAMLYWDVISIRKSRIEERKEKGIKYGIATVFFFAPVLFNKWADFNMAMAIVMAEIVLLFILLSIERPTAIEEYEEIEEVA